MSIPWEKAACKNTDPDLWFPDSMWNLYGQSTSVLRQQVRTCRKICFSCPILTECLEYATTHHEAGIWGGTTALQRKGMRKSARLREQNLAETA